MKKMGMKKASFMVLFLVISMIFVAGCGKNPDKGAESENTSSAGNLTNNEQTTTQSKADDTTTETADGTTADNGVEQTTQVNATDATEVPTETTEAVTETTTETLQVVEEPKPWDLLNNEPLNPTTSGYEELDRLIDAYMAMLRSEGTITDEMSNYQKVHSIYEWFIKRITYSRGMEVNVGQYSSSDPSVTPVEVLWATDLFNTYKGCCYNYSSAFMYVMRYLGYDAHLLSGQVGKYGGGTTPHCWLYVNLGGTAYTFDPDVDSNYFWRAHPDGVGDDTMDTLFCKKMDDMNYFYTIEKYHDN